MPIQDAGLGSRRKIRNPKINRADPLSPPPRKIHQKNRQSRTVMERRRELVDLELSEERTDRAVTQPSMRYSPL